MERPRSQQRRILTALLGKSAPATPCCVIAHGAPSTGKSTCIETFLKDDNLSYSWVNCDECATSRILLQRAIKQILPADESGLYLQCENIDILCSLVKDEFRRRNSSERHVLVLNKFDQMPEYHTQLDLLATIPRFSELEMPPQFSVIVVLQQSEPKPLLANLQTPRIFFPRFTKEEVLQVLEDCDLEPKNSFRSTFFTVLLQAVEPIMGTDASRILRAAHRIWPEFYTEERNATNQFNYKRYLFGTEYLVDTLPPTPPSIATNIDRIPSLCLIAAYLSSYNNPRYDMRCFSLAKSLRSNRRETRPKKAAVISPRSLQPPVFEMERMLAILHSIMPNPFEVYMQREVSTAIATLLAQNLITVNQGDVIDSRAKWRIKAPWSYIQLVANDINFPILDYIAE